MATRPAPRQRRTPRTMLVCGLAAVATATVVGSWPDPGPLRPLSGPHLVVASAGPRPPAAPASPPPPRLAPNAPESGRGAEPDGPAALQPGRQIPPSVGSGMAYERGTASRAPAYVPSSAGVTPDGYHRSLVYSGLIGLAIATTGLAMIGRRRRLW